MLQTVGEYLFSGDGVCVVIPCNNAVAGEYYTGAGSGRYGKVVHKRLLYVRVSVCVFDSVSANITGACPKDTCNRTILEAGE